MPQSPPSLAAYLRHACQQKWRGLTALAEHLSPRMRGVVACVCCLCVCVCVGWWAACCCVREPRRSLCPPSSQRGPSNLAQAREAQTADSRQQTHCYSTQQRNHTPHGQANHTQHTQHAQRGGGREGRGGERLTRKEEDGRDAQSTKWRQTPNALARMRKGSERPTDNMWRWLSAGTPVSSTRPPWTACGGRSIGERRRRERRRSGWQAAVPLRLLPQQVTPLQPSPPFLRRSILPCA